MDTNGLSGSDPDASIDAVVDTSTSEPDASRDSGAHDGAAGDADGSPAGCAARLDATFCNDFESPNSLTTSVWSSVDSASGTIALTSSTSISPSHAATLVVQAGGSNCLYVRLTRRFPGSFKRISTDLFVLSRSSAFIFSFSAGSSLASTSYQALLTFETGAGATMLLQKIASGTVSEVGRSRAALSASAQGRWARVSAEYVEVAGTLAFSVDGVSGPSLSVPSDFVLEDPAIDLGPFCAQTGSEVLFDDVTVLATP